MAYLGRKGASAALTSSDIPDGSISAVKVAADVATQAEIDLKANLASPTLTTPNLGTPSAINLTNATSFPTAVGGGLGGHVVCIKRSTYNTETALSTSWATTFGNITHSMSDANNILYFWVYIPILVYGTTDTRGQIGISKDDATPYTSNGGYAYWQNQDAGDDASHSVKHCSWTDIVTPGDTNSHTWGMSAIEHTGNAIAMWGSAASAFLILMEMTGD